MHLIIIIIIIIIIITIITIIIIIITTTVTLPPPGQAGGMPGSRASRWGVGRVGPPHGGARLGVGVD
jgi:hypothetical protein